MDSERWVTVDDVAAHLGVTRDSIYRWMSSKGLPAHRVGRAWRFRLSEIDEWVRSGRGATDGEQEKPEQNA
jgi:excisionase family DNA binding protein